MKNKVPVLGRLRKCIEFAKDENIKNKVIVDIGCSNGLVASELLPLEPKKYIGIDPSPKAIKEAQENIKAAEFYISSAERIPLRDQKADIVLMFDVIEHTPKGTEPEVLKEAARVLKRGGVLLLSTPNFHFLTNILDPAWFLGHRHYKLEQLKKLIDGSGFKVQNIEVRGGLWFSIYLLWIYTFKWIFGVKVPRNKFLEVKDDKQFNRKGIHTIFVLGVKN